MTRTLRIEPEALDELEAAVAWYDAQRPGLGGDLLDEVRNVGRRLRRRSAQQRRRPAYWRRRLRRV